MKITNILLATAALIAFPINSVVASDGVELPQNIGFENLRHISPLPGEIDLEASEQGVASFLFNYRLSGQPNRSASLFATLEHDGEVLAMVPAGNTKQLSFDAVMDRVWQLSFFLNPDGKAANPGYYTLRLPEGFFLLGDDQEPSGLVELHYYIPPRVVEIEPVPDTYYVLDDFTVTFPTAKAFIPTDATKFYLISMYAASLLEIEIPYRADGNKVHLELPHSVTTPGTWKLECPEEGFNLEMPDGAVVSGPGVFGFYKIPEYSFGLPQVSLTPGEIEYFPGQIFLTVRQGQKVKLVNDKAPNYIYPVDSNGIRGNKVARYMAAKNPENERQVILTNVNGKDEKLILPPGNYQLVTGEKLYTVEGAVSDEVTSFISSMTFDYEILDEGMLDYRVLPESGENLRELNVISFTFPEAGNVEVKGINDSAWLSSDICNFMYWPKKSETSANTVDFVTAAPITLPGMYSFNSAVGSIFIDGVRVMVTARYSLSESSGCIRVENVDVWGGNFDIYTIDGQLVAKDADIDTLQTLPAGIYIAGGKKFVK